MRPNTPIDPSLGGAAQVDASAQFRQLLDALPVAAYVCDADGLITQFNRPAAALWGREPRLNDPIDRFCGSFRLFASDGTPIEHDGCWMALALETHRAYDGEEILVGLPDGRQRTVLAHASPFFDASGRVHGAVNILVDITDRKREEGALLAVKDELANQLADLRRLQALSVRLSTTLELPSIMEDVLRTAAAVEGTRFGVLSVCEGEPATLRIGASLGFGHELLGTLAGVPSGLGACGTCLQVQQRVVVEDVETDPVFSLYRDTARRAGFRAVHSTPLVTRGGKLVGVLSLHFPTPHRPSLRAMQFADLCARQAADSIENARLYAELRDADRAKNEFLAVLAHELRNPLAPIRSATQVLNLSGQKNGDARAALEVIDRQLGHMTRLIDDLLDIARITANKLELRLERVELAQVIGVAAETSRAAIEANDQELIVTVPPLPIHLDADLTRLAQVIANLLNNASKFSARGAQIWLTAAREGSDAVVTVRDSGIGIPSGTLGRIFDLFYQGEARPDHIHGGLGIGLTLVKQLIELHGGSVRAHSDGPGKGSEFVVRLPMSLQTLGTRATVRDTPDHASSPALRILIVDDNRDAADSLAMIMRMMGHEVRVAYDGRAAMSTGEEFRPSVALLDIGLPGMNGYELARALRGRAAGADLLLIATTGWSHDSDRERSRESGFDHHLVKPVDPATLLRLLSTAPQR